LAPVQLIQLDMLRMELKNNFLERPLYLNYCENITNVISDYIVHYKFYKVSENIPGMIDEIKRGQLSPLILDTSPMFPIQSHMAIRMQLLLTAIAYNLTIQHQELTDFFLRILFICALHTGATTWMKLSVMLHSQERYSDFSHALGEVAILYV